jgi:glycosyltransferase involved in cell wall biosynthesis
MEFCVAKKPLVSIIVVTYNSAKYVIETLESIKSQTYQNIELIVTDDCSVDKTVEVCQEWVQNNTSRFARIEIITSLTNTGIPSNCNRGFFASRGEWLKCIAGDDALSDDCIEINLNHVLKEKEIEVLQTDCDVYLENINAECFVRTTHLGLSRFYSPSISSYQQYYMLLEKNQVAAPAIFIKRDLITKYKGFDEEFKLFEDLPFWLRLTKGGVKIYHYNHKTVKYRIRQTSVTRQNKPYIHKSYVVELIKFSRKYKKKDQGYFTYLKYQIILHYLLLLNTIGLNNRSFLSKVLFGISEKISK